MKINCDVLQVTTRIVHFVGTVLITGRYLWMKLDSISLISTTELWKYGHIMVRILFGLLGQIMS